MEAVLERKPWLRSYASGVPAEIPALEFTSIPDMVEQSVAQFGDAAAFENFGVRLSFGDIDRMSRQLAAYLQSNLGLRKGERVAVMMPNVLQYPIALFGILRAGLTVVSVNPLYTARELEHQLKDSGAQAIVIFEGAARTLQEGLARTPVKKVILASVGDLLGWPKGALINLVLRRVKKLVPAFEIPSAIRFPQALAIGAGLRFDAPQIGLDDLAFLQYTGGTTGTSKGAMLLHRNILANVAQVQASFGTELYTENGVAVAALPFYHILALVMNCMLFLRIGGCQLLITNPRDIDRFVKTLARSRFTFLVGVNTLYNALLNHPEFARLDFSALRVSGGGGAPIQLAVAERWKKVTGRPLIEGYGLTETAGAVSINRTDISEHTGTTGLPIPSTEIEIRDEKGSALPGGEVGQVFVRGPQVMAGYWQRPDETAKVLGADGFLATGDLGLITPEGYLKIVDRLKDMILVSGFNVYPNEVEEVAAAHPQILEACAVGVEDPVSGEAIKLFVVRKDPALSAEQVIEHCRKQLTGYKVPRRVEFRDVLPKSPVGKILRRVLRDEPRK
jgi:long-chain acyl-CoA synthetase